MIRLADDRGSILIVVMAMTGILAILVGASFMLARRSIQVADDEEEVHGALAAAEAGLDDYLFRLNTIDQYWEFGSAASGRPAPPDGNLAFDQFVPVPGGPSDSEYTYTVDTSRLGLERVLVLESTGRAQGRERTISALLKQESFLDYVYFTQYETSPPQVYADEDQTWVGDNCVQHQYPTPRPTTGLPSEPSQGCTEIFWTTRDVVDGPFHTNDRFLVDGHPEWLRSATSSAPEPRVEVRAGSPTFARPDDPAYREPLEMPPSNDFLKAQADPRVGGEGCMFTGPTSLVLLADGRVRVTSPHTRQSGAGCGTWSDGVDPAQTIDIPPNGVIYVQPVPAPTSDPNHSATCAAASGNGLGYPISGDVTEYECHAGDAFVEGTLDGRLTIGAGNDITITWHIEYEGADDMLGLIAEDLVQVYHPVDAANANLPAGPGHTSTLRDVRIDAAILSVRSSFTVQNHDRGAPLGVIHLEGAIAQIYRGPVGTFSGPDPSTGYAKAYSYDDRFAFANPPSFLDPVSSSWRAVRVAEQFGG